MVSGHESENKGALLITPKHPIRVQGRVRVREKVRVR